MNATEQIRLLREALQMQIDFGTVGVSEWTAKYPQAEKDSVFVLEKTIREALSATATPPDDAAKPEPEFRAEENRVQQRRLSWCHFATIAPQGGAEIGLAQRIADALNGGGK